MAVGVKELFCILHLSQEAKILSECYRSPFSDSPAPLCGAKPQLRIWGLFRELSSYVEPRAKMTTTEIVADTTGDHGAHPAADGTAVAREVTNYDGTFEEAMECGLIEVPPPVVWNMWQSYRKLTHSAPTKKADGVVLDNAKESTIYTRVMTKIYGPNFKLSLIHI